MRSPSHTQSIYLVLGSAYGTAKAGVGIASVGVMKPDFIMKVRLSSRVSPAVI
jgi:hypothetical protein